MTNSLLPVVMLAFTLSQGFSQATSDTAFLSNAIDHVVEQHARATRENAGVFHGIEYMEPERKDAQHPYFGSEEWTTGTVVFDRQPYRNMSLLYDITSDQLITETPSGEVIALIKEKVNEFSLGERKFVQIENEQVANSLPRSGFYQVLYDGRTRVVAMRIKDIHRYMDGSYVQIDFKERSRYFLYKEGAYHPVSSKSSLLHVLFNNKQLVKEFMKKNQIRFDKNEDWAFVQVARFYDTLSTHP